MPLYPSLAYDLDALHFSKQKHSFRWQCL